MNKILTYLHKYFSLQKSQHCNTFIFLHTVAEFIIQWLHYVRCYSAHGMSYNSHFFKTDNQPPGPPRPPPLFERQFKNGPINNYLRKYKSDSHITNFNSLHFCLGITTVILGAISTTTVVMSSVAWYRQASLTNESVTSLWETLKTSRRLKRRQNKFNFFR